MRQQASTCLHPDCSGDLHDSSHDHLRNADDSSEELSLCLWVCEKWMICRLHVVGVPVPDHSCSERGIHLPSGSFPRTVPGVHLFPGLPSLLWTDPLFLPDVHYFPGAHRGDCFVVVVRICVHGHSLHYAHESRFVACFLQTLQSSSELLLSPSFNISRRCHCSVSSTVLFTRKEGTVDASRRGLLLIDASSSIIFTWISVPRDA